VNWLASEWVWLDPTFSGGANWLNRIPINQIINPAPRKSGSDINQISKIKKRESLWPEWLNNGRSDSRLTNMSVRDWTDWDLTPPAGWWDGVDGVGGELGALSTVDRLRCGKRMLDDWRMLDDRRIDRRILARNPLMIGWSISILTMLSWLPVNCTIQTNSNHLTHLTSEHR